MGPLSSFIISVHSYYQIYKHMWKQDPMIYILEREHVVFVFLSLEILNGIFKFY